MENGMLVCNTLQLQKGKLYNIYVTVMIVGQETLLILN